MRVRTQKKKKKERKKGGFWFFLLGPPRVKIRKFEESQGDSFGPVQAIAIDQENSYNLALTGWRQQKRRLGKLQKKDWTRKKIMVKKRKTYRNSNHTAQLLESCISD